MKVVILAGGFGTRIAEESQFKPKPMVEIGGKPILWHIMKEFSEHGYNEFIICAGYKQQVIKEYFAHYYWYNSDLTFDFTNHNERIVHSHTRDPWKVTIVDTGLNTMTGGRIKRIKEYVGNESFLLTYGDGVSNVDIRKLVAFHKLHKRKATITAYNVEQRFGILDIDENGSVLAFREKSKDDAALINIGYMVCEPSVFDYIEGDDVVWEKQPLGSLAAEGQLMSFKHNGFWQCMDTIREKQQLEQLWESGYAPWKIWKD